MTAIYQEIKERIKIRNVLVHVYDPTALDILILGLAQAIPDVVFYCLSNTCTEIAKILAGKSQAKRKSIETVFDPQILLGLCAQTCDATAFETIDMVMADLPPFRKIVDRHLGTRIIAPEKRNHEQTEIAHCDIPRQFIDPERLALINLAASNYPRVTCIATAEDYHRILKELIKTHGYVTKKTRFNLARKALGLVARHTKAVAGHFSSTGADQVFADLQIKPE